MAWSRLFLSRRSRRDRRRAAPNPSPLCRPRLEALEERRLPSTVTNLNDSGPGSLRAALLNTPVNGTIDFAPGLTGTIGLTSGTLAVTQNVNINGPGSGLLSVSGSGRSGVFSVALNATVVISNLAIVNGLVTGANATQPGQTGSPGQGGGIANLGTLTLFFDVLFNNQALGGNGGPNNGFTGGAGGDGNGGGIFNSGHLTVFQSIFVNNTATGGTGGNGGFGGVTGVGGNGGRGQGGGIYNTGTLGLTSSLLDGNVVTGGTPGNGDTPGVGGVGQGGGIENAAGSVTLINSTVTANSAAGGPDLGSGSGGGRGGGVGALTSSNVSLQNALLAADTAATGPDLSGTVNAGADHSLVGDGSGSLGVVNGENGNQVGTAANPIDAKLGVLQNNGGPTLSVALLPGSPAIDTGSNNIFPMTDQRGFNRTVNGTNDIGAYEFQPPPTNTTLGLSNTTNAGQPTTLSAGVSGRAFNSNIPPGSVTFFDGSTPLGTVPLNGSGQAALTIILPAGAHSYSAQYSGFTLGDYHFDPSTSNVVTVGAVGQLFALGGSSGRVQLRRASDGTVVADFAPYGPFYTGPVSVAMGDISGDGTPDLVTGAVVGNPDVRVYDGRAFVNGTFDPNNPDASLLLQFFPYALQFNVGATVAVADVNHDGFADLITGASVGNPDVRVFNGRDIANHTFNPTTSLLAQWFAYALQFNVGVNVAAGDISHNGFADIVTGATVGNPHVKVYNGHDIATGVFNSANPDASALASFFPYALQFNVGAFVAVGDVNGDGFADVITGASIGAPDVRVFDGHAIATGSFDNGNPFASQLAQLFAYDVSLSTGVTVGSADFEHNGRFDILTGPTQGPPEFRVVSGLASGIRPPAVNGLDGVASDLQDNLYVGA